MLKFEVTVGQNGRAWVKGNSSRTTLVVVNIIRKGDEADGEKERVMLEYAAGVIEKLR